MQELETMLEGLCTGVERLSPEVERFNILGTHHSIGAVEFKKAVLNRSQH